MKKISFGKVLVHIFLIAMSLAYLLPLVLMISISFSSESAVNMYGYTLMPKVFSTEAYRRALANPYQIIQSYKVTIIFSVVQTILAILVQALMAYPLSRRGYALKKPVTIYIFITMLFSGGLVPSYILNTQYLHLNNTIWIYILPCLTNAWNVIVFRTFFQGLPEELVEAAKIDGAEELRIFFTIIVPLSTPVFASLGFMNLVGKWNDWNTTLLYCSRNAKLYSLQYLLQKILKEVEYVKGLQNTAAAALIDESDLPTETMRYAMAMLASGPMLIVFPFFQKYFAEGLTVGSVKG